MPPGPPLAGAVREATEAGIGPRCSPDTSDRRSRGGRTHARRVVAAVETSVYDSGRPTPQKRRPAAAGPTDARGSHDVRRPEAQPRVGRSCGHGQETEAARGSRRDTYPSAKVAGTAHLTHRQAGSPYRCRGLEQQRRLSSDDNTQALRSECPAESEMPDHQLLRSCFLTVYPGTE
jgi:hypothetical protein